MSDATATAPGPFDRAFEITVGHEGIALDTTYGDSGNWTGGAVGEGELRGSKFGISAAAYPTLDIANLTLERAHAIYRGDYWDKVRGDDLPPALAVLVFDTAVNNGVPRAARWLQAAAQVTEDCEIGDETIAAITARAATGETQAMMIEFLAQRTNFDASSPKWRLFGLGWARRLCALPYQALGV